MSTWDEVVKAYDVRGLVPEQLDADMVRRLGAAFAHFCSTDELIVARDMRPSGVELAAAFADGVRSQGIDVVDLGLASTDLLYFASGTLGLPGAVLTASHNPAGYNGIKMCGPGATPVGRESGLAQIRADAEAGLPAAAVAGTTRSVDLLASFADHVVSFVDPSEVRPLRVIADTANGMGGLVAPAVFERLGLRAEFLYVELDGSFPNHPADPLNPDNLVDLQGKVLDTGADLGLAFDGDADRVFLVDDEAVPVSGSTTTAIVAAGLLARSPGATILHNVICSKSVPEVIRESGGIAVRTKVGHSYIKAVMAETGAVFGGEHSGHYYFADNWRADSGLIAACVVMEQLSRAGVPMSELRRPYERYAASGEINSQVADPLAVIDTVAGLHDGAEIDRLDGLTVDHGDWWFNLRPSNTEPLLRLNLEAADVESCAARTEELLSVIRA